MSRALGARGLSRRRAPGRGAGDPSSRRRAAPPGSRRAPARLAWRAPGPAPREAVGRGGVELGLETGRGRGRRRATRWNGAMISKARVRASSSWCTRSGALPSNGPASSQGRTRVATRSRIAADRPSRLPKWRKRVLRLTPARAATPSPVSSRSGSARTAATASRIRSRLRTERCRRPSAAGSGSAPGADRPPGLRGVGRGACRGPPRSNPRPPDPQGRVHPRACR